MDGEIRLHLVCLSAPLSLYMVQLGDTVVWLCMRRPVYPFNEHKQAVSMCLVLNSAQYQ